MKKLYLEKKINRLRKVVLKSKKSYDTSLKVEFSQEKDSIGWISMRLVTNNDFLNINISSAFPPFDDLVRWLSDMRADRLPTYWCIDEEGICKQLFVYAVDTKHVRLIVLDDCFKHKKFKAKHLDKIKIDTVIPKLLFIQEFYLKFSSFVYKEFDKEKWITSTYDKDLEVYVKELENQFGYWYHLEHWDSIHSWS